MAFLDDSGVQRLWYHTLTKLNSKIEEETLNSALALKVDKVEGKELSSNDFTNEEKEKLANLSIPDYIIVASTTEPENPTEGMIWLVLE